MLNPIYEYVWNPDTETMEADKEVEVFPNKVMLEENRNPKPMNGVQFLEVEGWSKFNFFESPLHLNKFLRNEAIKKNPQHGKKKIRNAEWLGVPKELRKTCSTYQDLYDQLIIHPSKAPEKIKQAVVNALPNSVRSVLIESEKWSDIKGDLNLDRIFAGKRKFMREQIIQNEPTKVIGIGVQMNALSHINAEVLSIRGVVASIAVECLEKLGHSVELFGYTHSSGTYANGASTNTFVCKIKKAGEKMATSALMNLTSSWCFRTAVFAVNNHASRDSKKAEARGQGGSRKMSDTSAKYLEQLIPSISNFAILRYVPDSNGFIGEIEKAVDALLDVLEPYI